MEESHIVKVLATEAVTHDVRRIVVKKPAGYNFIPGQATEVAINKEKWKNEKRPFTFTSLNHDENLEFTIKVYKDHQGVTEQIGLLTEGDELILHDVWGSINYDGPGYFIAGGAGVTPFISILRMLEHDDKLDNHYLIFSNKTEEDIILKGEFTRMLGDRFINTLTNEKKSGYDHRMIDKAYLEETIHDFDQHFYVCGPKQMVKDIRAQLSELGADSSAVVFEK
ncbi:hypothetical protein KUV50_15275 [Membranicola marinus]|uniref:FAD-binding FR-type domain-containing protein n=1 Tax=Membranihabitans marinus TaxID=1227546 RepID=A0A953HPR1_9BACT|nr:hypothetical protein [Membranihabitans marinus]MBY5959512.1 hypothetical protein [Membranihabitans marinus]